MFTSKNLQLFSNKTFGFLILLINLTSHVIFPERQIVSFEINNSEAYMKYFHTAADFQEVIAVFGYMEKTFDNVA